MPRSTIAAAMTATVRYRRAESGWRDWSRRSWRATQMPVAANTAVPAMTVGRKAG
jgi:hypothetical protein